MTAQDKLAARIATLTTEQVLEISIRMNLVGTSESIMVCAYAERELEKRMPEAEFLAHMDLLDTMMEAAA